MENILVSVIVPVYKAENCLRKCVDSIVNQSQRNIEILLINDGSPDNSGSIIDEYAKKDDRITVIHKENGGVASARNAGLKKATGRYITFVDCDDWIDLDFIDLLLNTREDADIIRSKFCYEYENGKSKIEKSNFKGDLFITQKDFKHHIYSKMIAGITMNSIWRTLYKKEILQNLLFNENLATAEDLIFSLDAYTNAKNFLYVDLPLYHYFQSSQGLTGRGLSLATKIKCNFFVSKALLNHLPIWGMDTLKNKILCYKRLLNITISKINRINEKDV